MKVWFSSACTNMHQQTHYPFLSLCLHAIILCNEFLSSIQPVRRFFNG